MKRKTSRDALRASQCRVSQCRASTAVRLYGPGDARSASLQVPIDKTEQLQ